MTNMTDVSDMKMTRLRQGVNLVKLSSIYTHKY